MSAVRNLTSINAVHFSANAVHFSATPGLQLQEAIIQNDQSKIKTLLTQHKELADKPLPNGKLPVHFALRVAPIKIAQGILTAFSQKGPVTLQTTLLTKDEDGLNALDHSIFSRSREKVSLIFNTLFGKDLKLDPVIDELIDDPQRIALLSDAYIKFLKQVCEPEDPCDLSDIHSAAWHGNLDELQILLNEQKDIDAKYEKGLIPLGIAIVRGLFHKDINARTAKGWTPLHIAVARGHFHIVEELVKRGAHLSILTNDGLTPLHLAAYGNNRHIVEILVNTWVVDIQAKDHRGNTPAHFACTTDHFSVLKFLMNKKIDLNAKNKQGVTAGTLLVVSSIERTINRHPLFPNVCLILHAMADLLSWVKYFSPRPKKLQSFEVCPEQIINSVVDLYMILSKIRSGKELAVFGTLFSLQHLPGFNLAFQAWKTWAVASEAFVKIRTSWKNRVYGLPAPLVHSCFYSVPIITSAYQLFQSGFWAYQNRNSVDYLAEIFKRGTLLS